ncbi:MAG: hypothetical protein ABEJ25_08435 [Candidatus Bipolaricaulia bacterium]
MELIKRALDPDEIINPSDYGLKDDLKPIIRESDVVLGLAVANKYTFLVWNEMKEGKSHGAQLYTIRAKNKEEIGRIEEGMPEGIARLSREESDKFTSDLIEENRESFLSALFGNWGSRF